MAGRQNFALKGDQPLLVSWGMLKLAERGSGPIASMSNIGGESDMVREFTVHVGTGSGPAL